MLVWRRPPFFKLAFNLTHFALESVLVVLLFRLLVLVVVLLALLVLLKLR